MEFTSGGAPEEGAENRLHYIFTIEAARQLAAELCLGDANQLAGIAVEQCLCCLRVAAAQALEEFGSRSGQVHGHPSGRYPANIITEPPPIAGVASSPLPARC